MNQRVFFEDGAVRRVGEILEQRGVRSVFLVSGASSYRRSGAEAALESILAGKAVTRFSDFQPNPQLGDVEAGLARYREGKHDIILAIGGGTAIDIAKLIGVLVAQPAPARAVACGQAPIEHDSAPLIAVPTTAGTGTEATHFAVVYIDDDKYSVAHPSMLPAHALVDPELTHSMPPAVTASTGLDALCQGVESLWNVSAGAVSSAFAREAIRLAIDNLHAAFSQPTAGARAAMARASHLAGKAINLTRTTAPHAISYTMTARYGVPHGHAVSLTLGPILAFNSRVRDDDVTDPRGPGHVRAVIAEVSALFGQRDPDDACAAMTALIASLGLPTRLADVGVNTAAERQRLVEGVNAERLGNNPRALTAGALRALLDAIA